MTNLTVYDMYFRVYPFLSSITVEVIFKIYASCSTLRIFLSKSVVHQESCRMKDDLKKYTKIFLQYRKIHRYLVISFCYLTKWLSKIFINVYPTKILIKDFFFVTVYFYNNSS